MRTIRIGSKMPAFNPWKIRDDKDLLKVLKCNTSPGARIYVMAHFDHPTELTEPAIACIDDLLQIGVRCVNQCPIIKGINDDAAVLAELFSMVRGWVAPNICVSMPPDGWQYALHGAVGSWLYTVQ